MDSTPRQDRRYWRRRVNRHVRKQRRARRVHKLVLGVAALALLTGMFLFAGKRAVRYVTESPVLALREIHVDGAERCAANALEQRLQTLRGQNLLTLDLPEIWRHASRDPWIRAVSVKRVLPDRLRVEVHERRPTALALIGELAHLVDHEGFVIAPCGPGHADDLPVLTGLDDPEHDRLARRLRGGARALGRLRQAHPRLAELVSEIDLSREDRLTVRLMTGGTTLLLDPVRVERNVGRYLELAAQIQAQLGGVEYIDLRWNDRIAVKPRRRTT